jgi:hypothetical protein
MCSATPNAGVQRISGEPRRAPASNGGVRQCLCPVHLCILFALGAYTRLAAAVMLINFTVALLLVHVGQPFLENYDALVMLFGAAFLFLHGPGLLSLDALKTSLRRS